ncbi:MULTISPECIES: HlyD family type I secretion periplasmic adaptor subunit [unclassified Leisingera]|uniref:HlyD family type I secretion periplasmic adaptor subunit n=1 Tax=unclassified Leisingera TaxID=2614906 RepID=UPI00057DD459|nr:MULTISPECIES: HlyD family type I secretion periplasmic adaptor subunit [unclassified Leisingera]KIC18701.1 type I secretion membrane fusion protein [Leisingera sp. ANG-DT]KIC27544.1 type I secretion membrane fusion protein [Leisingera sp. ANG-M6]KIC28676.1 type I secretion membrane fusion protein [Leisingera sp. ANG-S5]
MSLVKQETRTPARSSTSPDGLQNGFRDLMPAGTGQDIPLPKHPPTRVRQLVLWLVVCGFGLFGGLVFWASKAELTSAVVAGGSFNVAGDRLAVQHFEGGILRELNVNEGDRVREGQVIARLDGRRIQAQLSILNSQLASALAQQARLEADLAGADTLQPGAELDRLITAAPELARLVAVQQDLLASNQSLHQGQIEIIQGRITQLGDQLKGRDARIRATEEQLDLVQTELADLTGLFEKGLVPKTRISQRQMQQSDLLGTLGALESDRGNVLEQIGEMEERLLQTGRDRVARIAAQSLEVQEEVLDLRQRLDATRDVEERLTIRAPRSGRVVGLEINTLGQVVDPGRTLLELMPEDAGLLVETRVAVADIDEVSMGSQARVSLTAYSFRSTPPVQGEVVMVAAGTTTDRATGETYYPVHIRIKDAELAALPNVKTLPGMPAQAMIETGRQTLANYLISPVLASMSQALKEGDT